MLRDFEKFANRVNDKLSNYFDSNDEFIDVLNDALFMSRKRIRGNLAYIGCGVVGGNPNKADKIAMAYEMITSSYILIDDTEIFDSGERRAGISTPRIKYGDQKAMLAALRLEQEADHLISYDSKLEKIFSKSKKDTILGEQINQKMSKLSGWRHEKEEKVIKASKLLTGPFLSGPLQSGAIVGYGTEKEIRVLSDYGMKIGTAYQLSDHIVDIVGDPDVTGKDTFSDILNSRKTLPINYSLEKLPEGSDKKESIVKSLGSSVSDKKKKELVKIFQETGALSHTYDVIKKMNKEALSGIKKLKNNKYRKLLSEIPSMYTEPLRKLTMN